MKRITLKIVSFLMAVAVLFTTTSFALDMHFCGGNLVEVSFFNNAKGCELSVQANEARSECSTINKSCCDNKLLIVEGQDDLQTTISTIPFSHQLVLVSHTALYLNQFNHLNTTKSEFKYYKPPRVVKPIFKLDESYLI